MKTTFQLSMKAIVFCFFILWIFPLECKAWNSFIPDESGGYARLDDAVTKGKSTKEVANYLGYEDCQYHVESMSFADQNNFGVQSIIFKINTLKIIFVECNDDVVSLNAEVVDKLKSEICYGGYFYDCIDYENDLKEGITQRCMTSKFISDITGFTLYNNRINDKMNDYIYYFDNEGLLISFKSTNGLNAYGRYLKEKMPSIYSLYDKKSTNFFGNPENASYFINIQAEALYKLPHALDNIYLEAHTTKDIYNFKMVMVAHYGDTINLKEFKIANLNDFTFISVERNNNVNINVYKACNTIVKFNDDGRMVAAHYFPDK